MYNAKRGLFNVLKDSVRKVLSPETYPCSLCSLTHTSLGMRKEWKQFVARLGRDVEFLHADEFKKRYRMNSLPLPVVLEEKDGEIITLLAADAINACKSIEELKAAVLEKLV